MKTGDTEANKVLERLLKLEDGDLRNCLGIAIEYHDHPTIKGKQNYPQGNRLMDQLKLALDEAELLNRSRRRELGT